MRHENTTSKQSSLLASATEDELVVSQILLDLKSLVSFTESLAKFNWCCTRRRSCLDQDPPLPREPSRPPPFFRRSQKIETEERTRSQIKTAAVPVEEKGGATASPDTPLAFSPSESDEKFQPSTVKISRKRWTEECTDTIERLTQSRDELRGEVDNVQKFYKKLKAYNSELNAMKHEVMNNSFPKQAEPQMEIREGINRGTDLTRNYRIHVAPHQLPYIKDPMVQQKCEYPIGLTQTRFCSSDTEAACVHHLGPLGIDLNFPAAEAFGEALDASMAVADQRARFAEARRKRRGLMKAKSMKSAVVKFVNCQKFGYNYENCVS